jgi:hypothetical protein
VNLCLKWELYLKGELLWTLSGANLIFVFVFVNIDGPWPGEIKFGINKIDMQPISEPCVRRD